MKNPKKNLYEGMYILNASLSEEAVKHSLARVTDPVEGHGGEILKVFNQGRKKLAYEINGHKQGYYYLVYFSVIPGAISDMWKEYHLNEDLVRFMTLRVDTVPEKIEFKPIGEE
ncbi:MAG: 30S ribosomal protein S6 [Simkaniaceae bacterium]|nr:30S ribosomal protein S6 [Simkaniaceae bacterium]